MGLDTAAGCQAELTAIDAAISARTMFISEYGMFGANGKRTVYRTVDEILQWRGFVAARLAGLQATSGVGNRRTYMTPKSFGSW